MKQILTATLIIFSMGLTAKANPAKNLLTTLANEIETTTDRYVTANGIETHDLSQSSLRNALFRIQTLSDMYSKKYSSLRQVWRSSKSFEDTIGGYRAAHEKHTAAVNNGKPQAVIDRLKKKKEQQLVRLEDYIKNRGWQDKSEITRLKGIIAAVPWADAKTDQNFAYESVMKRLEDIDAINWNMYILEGRHGLHDFKKVVRWYRLEAGMLIRENLVKATNQCHTNFGMNNGVCEISRCMQDHLTELYGVIGDIKDKGEQAHAAGEELPMKYHDQADEIYQEKANTIQVFSKLAKEYKACAAN